MIHLDIDILWWLKVVALCVGGYFAVLGFAGWWWITRDRD